MEWDVVWRRFVYWVRDIRWRSCGSNEAGTMLHSASTPIFPGEPYDLSYTQQASFTPGVYGQYEILSRSIDRWCSGEYCTDADSVRSSRCVTLADFSVAISGPTSVYADRTVTWTAVLSGGTAPFTYQWYVNGAPSGDSQSVALNTGATSFQLGVDVTDAMTESRGASQFVTVQLAPPTNCQAQWIGPPANYLRITWTNSGDAGVSTEVEIMKNGGPWTLVGTAGSGVTSFYYVLGSQTGLFYARVRHAKSGYNASAYCTTGAVTVG